jgi:hypothetical protein
MKVTTLMLIIGALGLIAYNTLSIAGFLGYFFLFLTVFTGAGLWSKMNVWMPISDVDLIQKITLGCLAVSIVSFAMSIRHSGIESLKKYLSLSLIFLVGLIVGILPWAIKNGSEA